MKQFLKIAFGSFVGILLAFVALCVLLIIILNSQSKVKVNADSYLEVKFNSVMPEHSGNVDSQSDIFHESSNIGIQELKGILNHAANDKKIKGLIINQDRSSLCQEKAISLMDALISFKESGKEIIAYSNYYDQHNLLVCSAADKVYLNPNGAVSFNGYAIGVPFFKNLMDKFGLEAEIFYAGDFKSATEPFRLDKMSELNKIQLRSYINNLHENLLTNIQANRKIDPLILNRLVAQNIALNPDSALSYKLVDRLIYIDELYNELNIKATKSGLKQHIIPVKEYQKTVPKTKTKDANLAVVYLEGPIAYEGNGKGIITKKIYEDIFRELRYDDEIESVVLRINSPGGESFTSDLLWREIELLKANGKKVIASIGEMAASGGYYLAVSADTIFAASNSLTGSIGAYLILPKFENFFAEKMGVKFDSIKTSDAAFKYSPFFDLTEGERKSLQEYTIRLYNQFISRVADGRNISHDSIKSIANGRVWTGKEAMSIGLIDKIGGLEDAVEYASGLPFDQVKYKEFPEIKLKPYETVIQNVVSSQVNVKISNGNKILNLLSEEHNLLQSLMKPNPQSHFDFKIIH